jgi:hypothetical protein
MIHLRYPAACPGVQQIPRNEEEEERAMADNELGAHNLALLYLADPAYSSAKPKSAI